MSICIKADNLTRIYKYSEKQPGLKGSIKALFYKKQKEKIAVDSFSFEVEEGEFLGLIGPNGAGKTTLVKMLTGIIQPSSGSITVMGYNPSKLTNEFKKKYALVMGQKSQLWWDLPAMDSFLLNKEIYEIPSDVFKRNLDYFIEVFDVKKLLNTQVRRLSLGERMKMELISCLLHDPKVLFLDEPTIGLDAVAQKQIRQYLKKVNEEKKITIILTSHYMEDIKHLCKRVVVINQGKKLYDGFYDSIIKKYSDYKVLNLIFENPMALKLDTKYNCNFITPHKVEIKVHKDEVQRCLNDILSQYDVNDISIEDEDIVDIISKIYKMNE